MLLVLLQTSNILLHSRYSESDTNPWTGAQGGVIQQPETYPKNKLASWNRMLVAAAVILVAVGGIMGGMAWKATRGAVEGPSPVFFSS